MADPTRQKSTVFVGGLDNQVNENTLYDAFVPFGEIVEVSLPKPELKSNHDPHRGFGYVEFSLAEDAREAIDNMDQSELYGRVIKVNQAKPQKTENEGLGSRTAIWEQEGYAAKYNVADGEEMNGEGDHDKPMDPMQGLEGLDEAGPRAQ
ncbi:Peptidyl-prolyl cis-trans isomerase E [Fulvia fulva]|uniref:Peptidyl-prolyl cis-trans isomerase E n=1 Tax=Passalora fulva TaxID=5499 RepID=A0A9Q8L882_PASFU|nr:Peptidyl-prolyl cis-trans isomerase E [Fulvia fulva]KAK4634956.1 Peptidyl-prolyl cis-trans isomerase E [Fulvia fulva]KAK4636414.1 Peptidyl-prolyl cis-trans isomerase E [Fulvia fulva]UJO12610.1 Peptidyl-prolyl cis-trans isomerase E [Fulvia fulva]WPV08875.1 Peptidyl-prolyl cis-trans isomerase E [Fulvia fulva]WPV23702.1 Peptidyl-prolyl cis-trans isomerase E [Fulvia fulva]